ncbi:hypothetical protein P3S67_005198 [Capsicum chacoense]
MLLSLGHSPRHLSSSSPSPSVSDQNLNSTTTNHSSSTVPTNKRRSKLLDEDTYISAIEKIIERDFFPDIPKLLNRLDWLETIRTGDPVQIRDAYVQTSTASSTKVNEEEKEEKRKYNLNT